jgi:hypothetical protein
LTVEFLAEYCTHTAAAAAAVSGVATLPLMLAGPATAAGASVHLQAGHAPAHTPVNLAMAIISRYIIQLNELTSLRYWQEV